MGNDSAVQSKKYPIVINFSSEAARWAGFVSGAMITLLGLIHVCRLKARLEWPPEYVKVTYDVQSYQWRTLFSFAPNKFLDHWTPILLGALGLLCHMKDFQKPGAITKNFIRYAVFLLIAALFGCIGYEGGLGILFSIAPLLACILCVTAFVLDQEASASLKLGE